MLHVAKGLFIIYRCGLNHQLKSSVECHVTDTLRAWRGLTLYKSHEIKDSETQRKKVKDASEALVEDVVNRIVGSIRALQF